MPKSVTVKIGGDTSDVLKEMQKADREINKTQKTANNLAKSLEFEFDGQRAAQAQKQFQAALEQTETKAQRLRDKLKELEAGGKLNEESYSALELELAKTEAKAADLKNRLEEIKNIDVTRLADGFKNAGDKITAAGQKLSAFSVAAAGAIAGAAAIGVDRMIGVAAIAGADRAVGRAPADAAGSAERTRPERGRERKAVLMPLFCHSLPLPQEQSASASAHDAGEAVAAGRAELRAAPARGRVRL